MAQVLIADDNAQYRAAFTEAMQTLDHKVVAIASGREVLPALGQGGIDIVFLDVLMPGGGAISLVHEIRSAYPNLPIIVVTGNPAVMDSPILSEGLTSAQARIPKTTSLAEFDRLIRTSLEPRAG